MQLSSVLLELCAETADGASARHTVADPVLARCNRWLADHAEENIGVGDLGRALAMRRNALFAFFQKKIGMPPAEYILRFRIRRAQEALIADDESITDIAFNCGFSTSQYFARCFRLVTGCTPTEFREKYRRELPAGGEAGN